MNDITSTEKLLDLIRKKKEGPHPVPLAVPSNPPPRPKRRSSFLRISAVKKSIHVGIDIGHESLRLVKTEKISDKNWDLIDYQRIPFPEGLRKGGPDFVAFLKGELTRFCGLYRKLELWAIISAANVNVRHIRIPKVPKNQVENAVFWTFKREFPFNEKETLLDFEVLDEILDHGSPKWIVMAYTAPIQEVDEMKALFSRAGFPLKGLSIVPFSVQSIFRTGWIPTPASTVAYLFIGNDFSRIDVYTNGDLHMTRGIKAGINSMVETLQEALQEQAPSLTNQDQPAAVSFEQARRVLFSLSVDSEPLAPDEVGHSLTEEDKFRIILPAVKRLLRQVELTFEHYGGSNDNDKVTKIFVASAMNIYPPLINYVSEQLEIASDILDPLAPTLSSDDTGITEISRSERIAMTPALGMALSENAHSPNLLYTSREKRQIASINSVNRSIFAALFIATLLISGLFFYQIGIITNKNGDLNRLKNQLSQYQPFIAQDDLIQLAAKSKNEKYSSGTYSERYRSLAVMSELTSLTPANIHLVNLKAEFGAALPEKQATTAPVEKKDAGKEPAAAATAGNLIVEGIIVGPPRTLEVSLAGYLMKLQDSPIFRHVTLQKNSIERIKKRDLLRFTINVKIASA